ncbi:MAG: peptide deformylase [Clostridia bacterium]|nr:peptide deformylase [Clostridia bacterium]
MARRNVVKVGDEILRKKCKPVVIFDEKLWQLLDDMKETMIAEMGVGLAAPQVGVMRRACVVSPDGETFYEFINPVIIKTSGNQLCEEGCLSVPGARGTVLRPQKIKFRYNDRKGDLYEMECSDFLANICCHEFDHLDGILFTDKIIKEQQD